MIQLTNTYTTIYASCLLRCSSYFGCKVFALLMSKMYPCVSGRQSLKLTWIVIAMIFNYSCIEARHWDK